MPIAKARIDTPETAQGMTHSGQPVNIKLTAAGTLQAVTGESSSEPILRGVSRSITLWVEGTAGTDNFILEMCYLPVFVAGVFDPGTSFWGKVGSQISMTGRPGFVAAQTLDDMAYAVRVTRVSPGGVPTAGNFRVAHWVLRG